MVWVEKLPVKQWILVLSPKFKLIAKCIECSVGLQANNAQQCKGMWCYYDR